MNVGCETVPYLENSLKSAYLCAHTVLMLRMNASHGINRGVWPGWLEAF